MATFFEWRWAETHGGPSAASALRSRYDGLAADDPFWANQVAHPCPTFRACVGSIFAPFVYQRGAMAVQALRHRIGEEDFWTLLRRWAAERAGRTGSTVQFQELAEQVSGEDLNGFFDAWVRSASKPADTAANGLGR